MYDFSHVQHYICNYLMVFRSFGHILRSRKDGEVFGNNAGGESERFPLAIGLKIAVSKKKKSQNCKLPHLWNHIPRGKWVVDRSC